MNLEIFNLTGIHAVLAIVVVYIFGGIICWLSDSLYRQKGEILKLRKELKDKQKHSTRDSSATS